MQGTSSLKPKLHEYVVAFIAFCVTTAVLINRGIGPTQSQAATQESVPADNHREHSDPSDEEPAAIDHAGSARGAGTSEDPDSTASH